LIPGGVNFTIEAMIERVKYTPTEMKLFGDHFRTDKSKMTAPTVMTV
jgi:hypothetical protein